MPELIATVERRRELGAIAPADTHRVGVIFIRRLFGMDGVDSHGLVFVRRS